MKYWNPSWYPHRSEASLTGLTLKLQTNPGVYPDAEKFAILRWRLCRYRFWRSP